MENGFKWKMENIKQFFDLPFTVHNLQFSSFSIFHFPFSI